MQQSSTAILKEYNEGTGGYRSVQTGFDFFSEERFNKKLFMQCKIKA